MQLYKQVIYFGVIGTVAFVLDVCVLYFLKGNLGIYWGRAVSFTCAVCFTWIMNRILTFKQYSSGVPLHKEFVNYFLVMLGGGLVNYLTYVLLVSRLENVSIHLILAVAAGSCAGFLFNFISARFFVFKSM